MGKILIMLLGNLDIVFGLIILIFLLKWSFVLLFGIIEMIRGVFRELKIRNQNLEIRVNEIKKEKELNKINKLFEKNNDQIYILDKNDGKVYLLEKDDYKIDYLKSLEFKEQIMNLKSENEELKKNIAILNKEHCFGYVKQIEYKNKNIENAKN